MKENDIITTFFVIDCFFSYSQFIWYYIIPFGIDVIFDEYI